MRVGLAALGAGEHPGDVLAAVGGHGPAHRVGVAEGGQHADGGAEPVGPGVGEEDGVLERLGLRHPGDRRGVQAVGGDEADLLTDLVPVSYTHPAADQARPTWSRGPSASWA